MKYLMSCRSWAVGLAVASRLAMREVASCRAIGSRGISLWTRSSNCVPKVEVEMEGNMKRDGYNRNKLCHNIRNHLGTSRTLDCGLSTLDWELGTGVWGWRTKSFNDKRLRDASALAPAAAAVDSAPSPVRTSGKIIRVSSGLFDYICIWQSCESNYSSQTSPAKRRNSWDSISAPSPYPSRLRPRPRLAKLFIRPIGTCRPQLDAPQFSFEKLELKTEKWRLFTHRFHLLGIVGGGVAGLNQRPAAVENRTNHHSQGEHVAQQAALGRGLSFRCWWIMKEPSRKFITILSWILVTVREELTL